MRAGSFLAQDDGGFRFWLRMTAGSFLAQDDGWFVFG
jgi:hypothetical protein